MPKKAFLASLLLLAGTPIAYAQQAEISITDGGIINTSAIGENAPFEGVAFDHQFTIKAGVVLPGHIGIGLFYEQAHFSKKQTFYQNNDPRPLNAIVAIAEPQRTFGLEVYTEAYLTSASYLRFGALFGYARARIEDPTTISGYMESQDFSYSTGFDVSYVFPLGGRVNGVLNTGIRYSQANYGPSGSGAYISTYSFPIAVGVSYKFKDSRVTPAKKAGSGG
jgi:hypothetical protein